MSRVPNPAHGVGQDIRIARRALGWSQTELANRAQVSRPTIARVETGVNISTGTLEKVVKALGKRLHISDQP
ncbi:MAG: helix-turn-helix transcriptional regulator [Rothia sp.]|uniref:helix-turn-helix domain-containing protein n=1 Tax=Rothia sp. (in: high G+C Gram-positive bacteria) TaxID=1885016 RepID=UPI001CAD4AAC|nr:helix-turn-helix transcriptional regulator [Rothia sp. (in: high G+C Gram-positive bacteria)]MBF1680312.1 helix-turn-helix transcriptional regulator [Rothia sp. (in: high G+C Gram-positive bacteria)]